MKIGSVCHPGSCLFQSSNMQDQKALNLTFIFLQAQETIALEPPFGVTECSLLCGK